MTDFNAGLVNVGATESSVKELGKVILQILGTKREEATIQKALDVLMKGTSTHASFDGCTFVGGTK